MEHDVRVVEAGREIKHLELEMKHILDARMRGIEDFMLEMGARLGGDEGKLKALADESRKMRSASKESRIENSHHQDGNMAPNGASSLQPLLQCHRIEAHP